MAEYLVLGPLAATVDGAPVDLGGVRRRAVLAVLLLARNAVVPVDRILDLVWGDEPPPTAETALQGHVSALRKALGPDAIETRAPGYRLPVEPGGVDADVFGRMVAEARDASPRRAAGILRAADAMWRGPAIADLADMPVALAEAERLEELRLAATEARIDADLACGRHEALVGELEALVTRHPYRERLHGQLMLALYRAGRQAEALDAYTAARAALDEGPGLDPGPELQALQVRILQQDPGLAEPAGGGGRPGNLPSPPTPIIGRTPDLVRLEGLLAGGARCVTLTGPGGIGKTRLAIEAARAIDEGVPDGSWFVDLAPTVDARSATSAIQAALSLPDGSDGDPMTPLRAHLRDRRLLLVLDNCEQVAAIGGLAAALLAAGPGLRILATSRGPLGIAAEHEHPVAPLGLGTASGALDPDAPPDAVALFVVRARAAVPGFVLAPAIAADVLALCRRLDGLPLAIELAASRVRLLGPAAILARLSAGLDVLAASRGDLPERQRTLQATIDWSVRLLAEPVARAFRRCAAFSGGWTLEAFAAVAADPGLDALEVLGDLLAGSLVTRRDTDDGTVRFGMLDTIRSFAAGALEASGEGTATRERHAAVYHELAAAAATALGGPDELPWRDRMRVEQDNIRVSLDWLERSGRLADLVDGTALMARYWLMSGQHVEGRARLQTALDAGPYGAAASRATVLRYQSCMLSVVGDPPRAADLGRESVEAWRAIGDLDGLADAERILAMALLDLGDLDGARAATLEAMEHARVAGNDRVRRYCLSELAFLAVQADDVAGAAGLLDECTAAMRAAGDLPGLGAALTNLATLRHLLGDLDGAEAAIRESIETLRLVDDIGNVGSALTALASVLIDQGRHEEARAVSREAVLLVWDTRALRELSGAIDGMGDVRLALGDAEGAVRLFASAAAVRAGQALVDGSHESDQLEASLARARALLDDAAYERAWAAGFALTGEQAVREALAS